MRTESATANKLRDSSLIESGSCEGSSEGRIKSLGSTERESTPPMTFPSRSMAVLCHKRGFVSLYVSVE